MANIVELNIGGVHYTTSAATLCYSGFFRALISYSKDRNPQKSDGVAEDYTISIKKDLSASKDKNNRIFVDRDGDVFSDILSFLRCRLPIIPKHNKIKLLREADFYVIPDFQILEEPSSSLDERCIRNRPVYLPIHPEIQKYQIVGTRFDSRTEERYAISNPSQLPFFLRACLQLGSGGKVNVLTRLDIDRHKLSYKGINENCEDVFLGGVEIDYIDNKRHTICTELYDHVERISKTKDYDIYKVIRTKYTDASLSL